MPYLVKTVPGEELLEVCTRILIMKHGRIEKEVVPEKVSLDEIYSLCMEA
jgi:ribose transport system ATP-binding protein